MEQYLKLIQLTQTPNEYGQPIPTETITQVIATSNSVTRAEFYQAINKFTPTIIFEIRGYEYNGERMVETEDGRRFTVIRTYQIDFETLELTCELSTS